MRDIFPFLLPTRQQTRPSWSYFLQIQQCFMLSLSLLEIDPSPVLVLMVRCHILSRWWTRWVVLLLRWWHLIGGIVLRQMVCVTWLQGFKLSGQNNRLQWIRTKSVLELICACEGWVPNKCFQTWESVMIHNCLYWLIHGSVSATASYLTAKTRRHVTVVRQLRSFLVRISFHFPFLLFKKAESWMNESLTVDAHHSRIEQITVRAGWTWACI